ncbi:MAG: HD domain-containing protein [Euryarchaeota archaeon]|jgi:putative nucleotidyltransferase with HDIG domain|nr:HD domain-containing protein [Euryarchaeota archaeon]
MQAIKDAVHDYIELDALSSELLDTPEIQRLRRIRQLSTVSLVYPSANHTRFEHSLGVYHLASAAADHLDLAPTDARRVRAAALLHDVGHGPYGHQTEGVIERRLNRHHDEVGDLLTGEIANVLERYGHSSEEIAGLIAGEGQYGGLISGDLDVDRLDYLVRDAHHTGVPYGTVDHGRLVRALSFRGGELVVEEGNVRTAESVLIARTLMNSTVYRHHVSRIAGAMLDRAAEALLDAGACAPERFARFTDHELLDALSDCDATAEFAHRFSERDLYKRALWLDWAVVPKETIGISYDATRTLEAEIAGKAGCAREDVILDVPGEPSMPEAETRVVVGEEVKPLSAASSLVSGLDACARDGWRLGVYAPEVRVEAVEKAARRVLGIEATDCG